MRGVPVELNGEEVWFVPIEAGPAGKPKRDAMCALVEADEEKEKAPGEGYGEAWERACAAVVRLAKTMLVQNYGEERAQVIAESVPFAWAGPLVELATMGRLPADFTTGAKRAAGS